MALAAIAAVLTGLGSSRSAAFGEACASCAGSGFAAAARNPGFARGRLGHRFGPRIVENIPHRRVPRASRRAAKHNRQQSFVVAARRRDQVEAGRPR